MRHLPSALQVSVDLEVDLRSPCAEVHLRRTLLVRSQNALTAWCLDTGETLTFKLRLVLFVHSTVSPPSTHTGLE